MSKKARIWVALAVLSAGVTFQSGCLELWTVFGTSSLDFCSILNCEGGSFFDLCGTTPLLADCPNIGTTP